MKRFPDNARVLFIGSSITCTGLWMARVYDYYLRNFPDSGITMYNAGISGGTLTSALTYYDQKNGAQFQPTHAVILMGMNDVNHGCYVIDPPEAEDIGDKRLDKRMEAINTYRENLIRLTSMLRERGVELTLITPNCYDETTQPRAVPKVGCDASLEYLGEINRRLALEIGADFVNLHAPLRMLNAAETFIRPDRVHPWPKGYVVMAQLFLAAQGLVEEPTLTTLADLQETPLLPCNQARFEAEQDVRALWNAEWLILRDQPKDQAVRRAYITEFRKKRSETEVFWLNMIDTYLRLDGDLDKALAIESAALARAVPGSAC